MMKKTMALLLAAVLSLGCLSGCSSSDLSSPSTGSGSADSSLSTDSNDVPELKGPGNVTLNVLRQNSSFDLNEAPEGAAIEEVTGYHVEYSALPAESATESLMLQVSSGDDYDMVSLTLEQFQTLSSQGALMPLNDLLEAYGPDILAGVSEDSWGAVTGTDGNIYGLPVRYPYSKEVSCFILCRMDLMREAGVDEVPTTIDEFYEALVKIKEHFGDEYIPFAGPLINVGASNGTGGLQAFAISGSIASAFGIYNDWMVNDDGEVIYMTEAPGYADMVTFMNKLYTEGLLDPDYAVNTNTTLREKFSGEKAVMICANRGTVTSVTALMENNPDITWDDIGYIYALESASGEATYMQMDYLSNITAILRTSENAADCINFVNEKVKNQEYLTIGSEGVEWEKDEEGLYVPIQPAFTDNRTRADRYLDALDEEAYSYQWMARVRKSESNWYPFTHCALEAQEKRPYVFHESEFGLMPPSENYSKYQASQFESLTDFTMQLIFGPKTLENDLATFENDWKNNGGEEVRAELQAYIDSKQ